MTGTLILTVLAVTGSPDFQSILDRLREGQEAPGVSAAVVREGEELFAGASGLADLESGRAMTADTSLYAGSLTKIFTAVLTLHLVEQGDLSLEDVVVRIGGSASRDEVAITVFDLLTHTSGLEREGDFGYWFTADFPDERALADYLLRAELRELSGSSTLYSNVGYAALAPIIERASGEAYNEALHSRVLEPLGLTSTGAPGPGPDVATGYTPIGRVLPSEDRPFAGVGREVAGRHVREYHDAGAMAPAFGAYSSASDLGRLARFLLGNGGDDVLSSAARARMLTAQASGRGLGLRVGRRNGRRAAWHDGWFAAHRSHLYLDLDARLGVVVLTNSDGADPYEIAGMLAAAALGQGQDE